MPLLVIIFVHLHREADSLILPLPPNNVDRQSPPNNSKQVNAPLKAYIETGLADPISFFYVR